MNTVTQQRLDLNTEYDQLQLDVEDKLLRKSEVVEQYPDVFSLMFNNKDALKSHNKKNITNRNMASDIIKIGNTVKIIANKYQLYKIGIFVQASELVNKLHKVKNVVGMYAVIDNFTIPIKFLEKCEEQ